MWKLGLRPHNSQKREYLNGIFLAVCKGPGHIQWMQGNTKYLLHIFVISDSLGPTTGTTRKFRYLHNFVLLPSVASLFIKEKDIKVTIHLYMVKVANCENCVLLKNTAPCQKPCASCAFLQKPLRVSLHIETLRTSQNLCALLCFFKTTARLVKNLCANPKPLRFSQKHCVVD